MTNRMPKPGSMGFSTIGGFVGFWVGLGQYLNQDGSKYSHTFVVLDDETVVQAMPQGAEIVPLDDYLGDAIFIEWDITDEQSAAIIEEARSLVGTPYGFSDYLALALARFGFRPKWLTNYVEGNNRLICSQLADLAYSRAGLQLFNDGRLPNEVTPGDLVNRYLEKDWLD